MHPANVTPTGMARPPVASGESIVGTPPGKEPTRRDTSSVLNQWKPAKLDTRTLAYNAAAAAIYSAVESGGASLDVKAVAVYTLASAAFQTLVEPAIAASKLGPKLSDPALDYSVMAAVFDIPIIMAMSTLFSGMGETRTPEGATKLSVGANAIAYALGGLTSRAK